MPLPSNDIRQAPFNHPTYRFLRRNISPSADEGRFEAGRRLLLECGLLSNHCYAWDSIRPLTLSDALLSDLRALDSIPTQPSVSVQIAYISSVKEPASCTDPSPAGKSVSCLRRVASTHVEKPPNRRRISASPPYGGRNRKRWLSRVSPCCVRHWSAR